MPSLIQMVEKELKIPKEQLIEKGVRHFLEVELRNLSIEIKKLSCRYSVNSFKKVSDTIFREMRRHVKLNGIQM